MNKTAELYYSLLKEWCDALVSLQLSEMQRKELKGGMICPACGKLHGRTADAILPMMYMAKRTGEKKYLNCARGLFKWSDNMFREEGYYINDNDNDWTGITVFFCVQLGEALRAFSELLEKDELEAWRKRYFLTAEYVREKIDKIGGTINYPVTGAYAMALAWQLSDREDKEKYLDRAHELAETACHHILQSGLLFGEGHPCDVITKKGARGIDIGYNLEESLPALLEYSHLVNDEKVEQIALKSLQTHLKFFLPDGGMDNSFGSRSYKWSYWGSRTSDGVQAAAALLGDKCPEFERMAYENALLLQRCTHDGLLYGGPMFYEAGEAPCIHHTFCHTKVLAKALMFLEQKEIENDGYEEKCNKSGESEGKLAENSNVNQESAERKIEYFPDLRTYLVQYDKWRVTLTDYDYEYCPASHATGGAMTLLYHKEAGPICTGTMNRYYVVEPNNMQILITKEDICLTPRLEFFKDGKYFRNIQDLNAVFECKEKENEISFYARGRMTDEQQNGNETYQMQYDITDTAITLRMECSAEADYILPIIAGKKDRIEFLSPNMIALHKDGTTIKICTNAEFVNKDTDKRIFNPVGGFLAYPLSVRVAADRPCQISIS